MRSLSKIFFTLSVLAILFFSWSQATKAENSESNLPQRICGSAFVVAGLSRLPNTKERESRKLIKELQSFLDKQPALHHSRYDELMLLLPHTSQKTQRQALPIIISALLRYPDLLHSPSTSTHQLIRKLHPEVRTEILERFAEISAISDDSPDQATYVLLSLHSPSSPLQPNERTAVEAKLYGHRPEINLTQELSSDRSPVTGAIAVFDGKLEFDDLILESWPGWAASRPFEDILIVYNDKTNVSALISRSGLPQQNLNALAPEGFNRLGGVRLDFKEGIEKLELERVSNSMSYPNRKYFLTPKNGALELLRNFRLVF